MTCRHLEWFQASGRATLPSVLSWPLEYPLQQDLHEPPLELPCFSAQYKRANLSSSRHHESIQVNRVDAVGLPLCVAWDVTNSCWPSPALRAHLLPARRTCIRSSIYICLPGAPLIAAVPSFMQAEIALKKANLAFLLQRCILLGGLSLPLPTALSRDTLCRMQALLRGLWACARQLFIHGRSRLCP